MKKVLFSVLLTVFSTLASFANASIVTNARAEQIFATDFKEATNVKWTSATGYLQVSFTLDSKDMQAFYDHEGSFIAVSSKIAFGELPTNAKRALAKKLVGYTVLEAIK